MHVSVDMEERVKVSIHRVGHKEFREIAKKFRKVPQHLTDIEYFIVKIGCTEITLFRK